MKFISPYSRYLAVLPFVQQQRIEELSKQQEENKKKKLCPDNIPEENSVINFLNFKMPLLKKMKYIYFFL